MEECKSPEAEALVAAAVRGPNQAASAAARVEAHAAVTAVQAGVDKRRAEALAAVQAESQSRRAAAASAAATTAASATAAPSLLSPSPAVSEAAGVTSSIDNGCIQQAMVQCDLTTGVYFFFDNIRKPFFF